MTTQEEWRPVVGWEGLYEVSSLGRVQSVPRANCPGQVRALFDDGRYLRVTMTGPARLHVSRALHKIVLEAFVGPCPEGQQARHLDGNPYNNRASNLAYGTPLQNHDDRRRHGTIPRGEAHGRAKLDEAAVRDIRYQSASGWSHAALARKYGVSSTLVRMIATRLVWTHVED